MKRHTQSAHQMNRRENDFKCEHCLKLFSTNTSLKHHIGTVHTKRFKCDICQKTIGQKTSLRGHMTTAHNQGGFKCQFCSKRYGRKYSLQEHIHIVHEGLKNTNVDCVERVIDTRIH